MKRLWIAILCLVLAGALAVGGYYGLRHICLQMEKKTDAVISAAQAKDPEKQKNAVKDFLTAWDKYDSLLGAFVNHHETDDLDILIRGLSEKTEQQDFEGVYEDMCEIRYRFEHLKDAENPDLKNVF